MFEALGSELVNKYNFFFKFSNPEPILSSQAEALDFT